MNNIQELRNIIADAPDTSVTVAYYDYGNEMELLYINSKNELYEPSEKEWVGLYLVNDYFHSHRSLADIRAIIEQAERITELGQVLKVVDSACITWGFVFDINNPKDSFDRRMKIEHESARDINICREAYIFALEQQAKALNDIPLNVKRNKNSQSYSEMRILLRAKSLLDEAKKIRGRGE